MIPAARNSVAMAAVSASGRTGCATGRMGRPHAKPHSPSAVRYDLGTMKRCDEKIRYRTAVGARWALWGIWLDRYLRGRRHRRERRAYACPYCGGWHLTSQAERQR